MLLKLLKKTMSEFEKTIRNLRHYIEEEKKCYEILLALPENKFLDKETKQKFKQLLLGKAYEIACLDQLLSACV